MDRARSLSFQGLAPIYDATRGGEDRGRRVAEWIRPHLAPPVLEIGVGTGLVALGMRAAGLRVTGVDIAPAMLAAARDRLGAVVAEADAERLPYASRSLGGAYAVWVLHLVRDVPAVLAEVARVLRPGGRFVVVGSGSARPDEADVIVERMREQLWGPRPDHPERLAATAAALGWREVGRGEVRAGRVTGSVRELAQRYRRGEYSVVLDVDETAWADVVEPALHELEALPGADVVHSSERVHPVVVLAAPGEEGTLSGGTSAPA